MLRDARKGRARTLKSIENSSLDACEVSCRVRARRIALPLVRLHPERRVSVTVDRAPRKWVPHSCPTSCSVRWVPAKVGRFGEASLVSAEGA
jgi:hypothetical protein